MRLRRRTSEPPIDPCMGDPTATRLCDALTRRDWPAARDILLGADHPDDRAFYLEICGTVPGVQEWIGAWAVDEPLAQLVRGCHAVGWAWEARGGYQAKYTRDEQFRLFFERLRFAESYLYDVTGRAPDEVAAWAFLVRTARGLQLPLDDAEFRFREAVKRHPTNLKAHAEMMQTLCKKWSGSHEWMHQFAREAATRSPAGSMLPYLVALAHIEVTLDLTDAQASQYMARPDVRTDLRAAAGHSIWHPDAEFRPGWPLHLNTFALAFSLSGDLPAAASVFEPIGENVTALPWGYLAGGNEAKSFAAARKQALAGTGR